MGSTYQTIIFDLDGTLLNTLDDLTHAFNMACGQFDCRAYHPHEYKYLIGNGARHVIATLFERHKIPVRYIERCVQIFRKAYHATELARTYPYDGIHKAIDVLSKNNVTLNVLSNKPHQDTVRCIQQFFGRDQFKIVLGHQEDKPLKPDPTTTREILKVCHIPCHKGLFIGDTAIDIDTAHNSNMHAVGVTWGFRTYEELEASGADTIIDDPSEIVSLCL